MMMKGEESQKITLKEVLDLLGFSEVDGLLVPSIFDQGVSFMSQQDLDDLKSSVLASKHQSCHGRNVLKIDLTSQTNQTINDRGVAIDASPHQCVCFNTIVMVDLGPVDHKSVNDSEVAPD